MKSIKPALLMLLAMSLATGIIYPLFTTGVAAVLFPERRLGLPELLATKTEDPRWFWARPSAADYGTLPSGASNLAPTNKVLLENIQKAKNSASDPELLTSSGSGLDPHISPEGALSQVSRICGARKWDPARCENLRSQISQITEHPSLGFLGRTRVNVNRLNAWLSGR